ncbi:MAG: hypothetical protein CVU56_16865 [Deltaproteobacteria bacterium HGW-Deltaproteobacteria-14]|jgi:hypothetical protein|nr:MAG: hypothetical protein CVU56_16865 [Deltaproteobacteria bacterium HGW-Deltaproteobacteria-14]
MQRSVKDLIRPTLAVGAVLIGLTIALATTGLEKPVTTPPCGFVKAVLCAELPPDGATFGATLAPTFNPPERWRLAVWLDMPFLVAYATLLSLGLVAVARRRERARGALVSAGVAMFALAAALDAIENTGILLALTHVDAGQTPNDGLAWLTRSAAAGKFALLGGACAALGGLAWRAALPLALRLAYTAAGVVALAGLVGLARSALSELGALGVALACATVIADAVVQLVRTRRAA